MTEKSQVKSYHRKGKLIKGHNRKKRNKRLKNLFKLGTTGLAIGGLLGIRHLANKDYDDKIEKLKNVLNINNSSNKPEDPFSKLNKDRNKQASPKSKPFIVDDPNKIINKGRITERTKNLNRIMRGGVTDIFPGLATDLYAIQNKKITGKTKQKVIKRISQQLRILKQMGKFKFINKNIEFKKGRGKDKKKRKSRSLGFFGDKRDDDGKKTLTYREPVLKRVIPGGIVGGALGLGSGIGLAGLGRKKYKKDLLQAKAERAATRNGFKKFPLKELKEEMSNDVYKMSKKLPRYGAAIGAGLGILGGSALGASVYNRRKNTLEDIDNYKLPTYD